MLYKYPFKNQNEKGKLAVWGKGTPIQGYDSRMWRRDAYGSAMRYTDHGDTSSVYGWEIDHIKPSSLGGSNQLTNLQPLQWERNRAKSDTYPAAV
jgi:5-methylcytosine-specific restriction endonuclease McrA